MVTCKSQGKKKNTLIRALRAVLLSRRMAACLCVMRIFDIVIVKPHRFFVGKSNTLHKDRESWKGRASICNIADGLYDTPSELEKKPTKL
jgi:hypothetical protein